MEHTRLACKPSEVASKNHAKFAATRVLQARGLASSSGKEGNFIAPMYYRCLSRAQLVEPTRGTRLRQGFVGQAAYAPVETLMPK